MGGFITIAIAKHGKLQTMVGSVRFGEFFDTALANECLFGDAVQDTDYPKFKY